MQNRKMLKSDITQITFSHNTIYKKRINRKKHLYFTLKNVNDKVNSFLYLRIKQG